MSDAPEVYTPILFSIFPRRSYPVMIRSLLIALLSVALCAPAFAQSQAINGTIEGTVADQSGAVLPGVTVTVHNLETGTERSVVTNEAGLFRALLLPLG